MKTLIVVEYIFRQLGKSGNRKYLDFVTIVIKYGTRELYKKRLGR